MKKGQRIFAWLLAFLMVFSTASVFAEGNIWSPLEAEKSGASVLDSQAQVNRITEQLRSKLKLWELDTNVTLKDLMKNNFKEGDRVTLIVELSGDSGLETANRRGVAYEEMLDAESLEREMLARQSDLLDELTEAGIDYTVKEQYTAVLNAVAIEVNVGALSKIEQLKDVEDVYFSNSFHAPKTEQSRMYYSHEMIYDETAWKMGYKGQGSVVAVLDTGIDWLHKDFQTLTDPSVAKLDEQKVDGIIQENGLKGRYFSPKVPYGYNYFDRNQDVKDSAPGASMHGQHVSGTVAANGEIKGVAPEAQILGMKVFGNDPLVSTTSDHIYVKAFDDAIKLGADVINMSLGSPAGFNDPKSATSKAITNAVENGIVFAISAGNSGSQNFDDKSGWFSPEDPDISMLGSPSIFKDSTSVASINNVKSKSPYFTVGDRKIPYIQAVGPELTMLKGSELEYVDCGLGKEEDFTGKDVKGKIALIKRGGLTFQEKLDRAHEKGAIAGIVFNNTAGSLGMSVKDLKIPSVSIGLADGEYMLAQIAEQKNKVLIEGKSDAFDSPTGHLMSGFSSWGPTPTLDLKPEITAPGGNIYSTMNDDQYDMMSGTSMAAPHVSGAYAVVNQYIREKLSTFKYNKVTANRDFGLRDIPNRSYIIGTKAFSEDILHTSHASMLYDEMKNGALIYKTAAGKYFDKTGEVEFTIPSGMVYYNAHGEVFSVNPAANGNQGELSQEPLTKGDTTRLAKVLLMNTANLVSDENGGTVSPRKQGAGLINVSAAVQTPAVLLSARDNEPKVELRNIEDTKFDMNLRVVNASDKDLEYTVDVKTLRDVLGQDEEGNIWSNLASVELEADVDAPEKVTVPANGFADFRVSVDFAKDYTYRNMYVEGFVQLKSDTNPTLSIPFMGFYGHYSEPKALYPWSILGEGDTKGVLQNQITFGTWVYYEEKAEKPLMLKSNVGPAYVTPNPSRWLVSGLVSPYSSLSLYHALRRNVEELQYRLLDENGEKEIAVLKSENKVRKNYKANPQTLGPNFYGTANGYKIPDGNYMYEVRAKSPMPNADWESKMAPVVVDGTAPRLEMTQTGTTVKFTAADDTTSVVMVMLLDDAGKLLDVDTYSNINQAGHVVGKKSVEGEFDLSKHIKNGSFSGALVALDQLGNDVEQRIEIGESTEQPNIYIISPAMFSTFDANAKEVKVKFAVFDCIHRPVASVNDKEAEYLGYDPEMQILDRSGDVLREGAAYTFESVVPVSELKQGYNDLIVKAVTADGKFERSLARTIFIDSEAPEMTLEVLPRTEGSATAEIKVTAKDAVSPWATLYVNGSQVHYFDHGAFDDQLHGFEDTYTVTVNLEEGENVFEFMLEDDFGNSAVEKVTIVK